MKRIIDLIKLEELLKERKFGEYEINEIMFCVNEVAE
jgi:hypothetical protein